VPKRAGRAFPDLIRYQVMCSLRYVRRNQRRALNMPISQHGVKAAGLQARSQLKYSGMVAPPLGFTCEAGAGILRPLFV